MPLLPKKANTPDNQEGLDDRSPLPAGDYTAHCVKTEFKQTKAKTGHYLAMQFKVLEGDHKGRSLFTNLNLDNPNPVAVEIANKELNSICQAANKQGVEDSDELLQIPLIVTVKVTEGDENYPPSNEISGYKALEAVAEAAPVAGVVGEPEPAAAPQAAAPAEAAPSKLPWE